MDAFVGTERFFHPAFRPISTNSDATTNNLPGPGRNVGLLFDFLGRKVEKRVNNIASRRDKQPRFERADPELDLTRSESIDSIDTNATSDNLPGPGRNLGKLYFHLGNKLANTIDRFLSSRGYGPAAVADAISILRQHNERDIRDLYFGHAMLSASTSTGRKDSKLKKKCEKLVRYSRSKTDSTAITACNRMVDLAILDPYLKELFSKYLPTLDSVSLAVFYYDARDWSELDPLLASSRKALISVTEVEVQTLWTQFYVASAPGGIISSEDTDEWYACMDVFLSNFTQWLKRDASLSFLGLRHMLQMMQNAASLASTIQESETKTYQCSMLVNIIVHLLVILEHYLRSVSVGDVPMSTFDWDTLEALLGRDGEDSTWAAQLYDFDCDDDEDGSNEIEEAVFEEIEVIFTYFHPGCVKLFADLCRRNGRHWIPPVIE